MFRISRLLASGSILLIVINFWIFVWNWRESFTIVSDEKHFNDTLMKILTPRWTGSLGHSMVGDFLIGELHQMGFIAHRDKLTDNLVYTNVLGIMNIDASRFLLLSCHYDSKYIVKAKSYVGATDGAVSCAILLNMAKQLSSYLRGPFSDREDIGLVLAFFDGHESFNKIEDDFNSLNGSRRFVEAEILPLKSIELVVTLNLIGAPNHIYMSHFDDTYLLHKRLANIEKELKSAGKLVKCHKLFHDLKDHDNDIPDDHYPFLEEDVTVMHIIPHTYPEVWHTVEDNLSNLHWPTIQNINAIFTHFVYEYLYKYEEIDNSSHFIKYI